MVVLEISNGHPEEPGSQGLKALILLGNREGWANLAGTLEEASQVLDLGCLFLVVLEMCLHLHHLLQGSLEGIEVFPARLSWTMLGIRRGGSRGEGAALSNEVGELGLVFPSIHGINNLYEREV